MNGHPRFGEDGRLDVRGLLKITHTLRARWRRRAATEQEVNEVSQVSNINILCGVSVNTALFPAWRWWSSAEQEVNEISEISNVRLIRNITVNISSIPNAAAWRLEVSQSSEAAFNR
jgi:hypothetical protein